MILTNVTLSARKLLALHNGRGAQEAIFAKLKSQTQMDYIPCRRRVANQTWLLSAIMAHNLNRELQMSTEVAERSTTEQCAPWWSFAPQDRRPAPAPGHCHADGLYHYLKACPRFHIPYFSTVSWWVIMV